MDWSPPLLLIRATPGTNDAGAPRHLATFFAGAASRPCAPSSSRAQATRPSRAPARRPPSPVRFAWSRASSSTASNPLPALCIAVIVFVPQPGAAPRRAASFCREQTEEAAHATLTAKSHAALPSLSCPASFVAARLSSTFLFASQAMPSPAGVPAFCRILVRALEHRPTLAAPATCARLAPSWATPASPTSWPSSNAKAQLGFDFVPEL
ncbi:transcriptional regulatory protein AlgP-like [Triticum dicoccoides]|uniref:transcriptional regulatory protein AlgP-like n=1 Tax=Triticum dicoccoides TaxID=85692 RepID=UPI00189147C3|nr:transcriptional regulatory protein AlgP-like [Triticum dicoccoides]